MHCFSAPVRAGLTLVEILAVVIIIGLLAATLFVGLGGKVGEAKRQIAQTQMLRLQENIEAYRTLKGRLPGSLDELAAPNTAYSVEPGQLKDPWGAPYQYLVPGDGGRDFEIRSLGADAQPGGDGENADVSLADIGKGHAEQ